MGAPTVDPPAGTTWKLHRNVQIHSGEVGETISMIGGLFVASYGWYGEYSTSPTFNVPGVLGNDHYWFDKWYFANFRLYLDHVVTGEILGVQPGVYGEGAGTMSGSSSPFSGGQNIMVMPGEAWVEIDTRIGSGPAWPANLRVRFTLPRWGIDQFGIPVSAEPRSGAGLIQWRGDVWVAEPSGGSGGPPPGPPPGPESVLGAEARPSPQAPRFQLRLPQRDQYRAMAEPGDVASVTFPRWGFSSKPLMIYEIYERWHANEPGQTVDMRYEREFCLVEPGTTINDVAKWDLSNWDEGVWDV